MFLLWSACSCGGHGLCTSRAWKTAPAQNALHSKTPKLVTSKHERCSPQCSKACNKQTQTRKGLQTICKRQKMLQTMHKLWRRATIPLLHNLSAAPLPPDPLVAEYKSRNLQLSEEAALYNWTGFGNTKSFNRFEAHGNDYHDTQKISNKCNWKSTLVWPPRPVRANEQVSHVVVPCPCPSPLSLLSTIPITIPTLKRVVLSGWLCLLSCFVT